MPVHSGSDSKGKYYQWGKQKKYYYKTEKGEKLAFNRAKKQGYAFKGGLESNNQFVKEHLKNKNPTEDDYIKLDKLFKSSKKNVQYLSEKKQVKQYEEDMKKLGIDRNDDTWTIWIDTNIVY